MMKVLNVAVIALMITGAAAFACDTCGCTPKKAKAKAECSSCTKGQEKKADKKCAKKCAADCTKACCKKPAAE